MLKLIALTLVVLLIGVLAYAATRPNSFTVQRSITIKAPPEKVYALINDFHNWALWSPWEHIDPSMTRHYSGAAQGDGTIYEWVGNGKVGSGRMEIVSSTPASKIRIKLDFLKPFEAHNFAEYTLTSAGDSTTVTWQMYGPNPYIAKLMQVFCSMDKMVGKDFETGLANLKAQAEK
jgi:uncharacterized protein YndB with AHSA1/START domain